MSETRRHDLVALTILASLITILFADVLLGINTLYIRDLVHYYFPAKHLLREIVLGGEFPYWNPLFSAGQPLAANPEHEIFYPLTWLILLPGYRIAFHLLIVVHLYIGAFTMYALLRSMRMSAAASFFGALSFVLGGICLSYLNLLPCLFTVVWLPLTCLFTRRFLRDRSRRDFALAALSFGIALLVGEPSTILQIGFVLGFYAIYSGWRRRRVSAAIGLVGLISIGALFTGAVQMLPAADHAAHSVRARGFQYASVTVWSMPLERVAELVYPHVLGRLDLDGRRVYWGRVLYGERAVPFLYSIYPGLLISVLALAGLLGGVRGWPLVVMVVAFSLALAFGGNTPLWRMLHDAGLRSLRYPEKFVLMAQFALTVFAARTLDELLGGNTRVRRAALTITSVTVFAAAIAALFAYTPSVENTLPAVRDVVRNGWLVAIARGVLLVIILRNAATMRRPLWLGIAGTFLVIDLAVQLPALAPRMPASFSDAPQIASRLPADRTGWRLFHQADWHRARPQVSPYFTSHPDLYWIYRNGMFPHITAQHGIATALDNDYDKTLLLPTTDFLQSVADLSDSRRDWVEVVAWMSNVWYRAVFIAPQEAFDQAEGDRRVMQPVGILPLARSPRYTFADRMETIRDRKDFVRKLAAGQSFKGTAFVAAPSFLPAQGRVRDVHETANSIRLDVEAAGRAFLVMSITPHKYWRITIDGREAQAVTTNIGYQGVLVPNAGRHVIEMRYRNPLVAIGGAISLFTILALLVATRIRTGERNTSPRLDRAGDPHVADHPALR